MKKLKPTLLILAALSCLLIGMMGVQIFRFNQRIKTGLAEKSFLPPTEYYSAPREFSLQRQISRSELKAILNSRQYRARSWDERLFPGDYAESDAETCHKKTQLALPENSVTCLLFSTTKTLDPELSEIPLQMLSFDSEDKISATFQGNPLRASTKVLLEPELVAQYLDGQPIMQSYRALGEVPPQCLNAVLAIEDSRFLEHSGVSITGIGRALITNVFKGKASQGGSTITQQLVKNYFLTSEKTLKRKLTELVMSILLESHSSKDEILETYLNVIYLGQNGPFQVRGFGAAAQYYFNKPLEELELHECSLLAAILNSPGLFDPFRKPQNALKRRSLVLERMESLQMISSEEAKIAGQKELPKPEKVTLTETAPYYINVVNRELQKKGLDLAGVKIFTGLSLEEQEAAQKTVQSSLSTLEKANPKIKSLREKGLHLEGILLSAHNETGLISAIVGGRGYKLTQFNRALDGHRQVGSIMKPFVFLTALLQSQKDGSPYNPLTLVKDIKVTHRYEGQKWSPVNYGKKYYGEVPMYFALKNSLNAATANLGIEVGISNVIETARSLGIRSKLGNNPSVTLGSFELYPIEVLESYTALARMGNHLALTPLRAITDLKGLPLYQHVPQSEQKVPAEKVASLISMMKQTVQSGTARSISQSGFSLPAAGKTGTTSDNKDAWFAGFTPQQTTVAWVGYDSPVANGLTGASGAIPIWLRFMKNVTVNQAPVDFAWPENSELRHVQVEEPEVGPVQLDLVFSADSN